MAAKGELPQVIFLDAVGTLFGVAGSVGKQYGDVVRRFGVTANDAKLDRAFFQAFEMAPPCVFPEAEGEDLQRLEFAWWKAIAVETFEAAEVMHQLRDFDTFFLALYDHFATATPWELYPETVPTLCQWRSFGVELGVISNFDTRLYRVLTALELVDFFQGITLATEVGAAKPNPLVFASALQKHHCEPDRAMHIGDSFKEDYQGAKQVGMQARWVQRKT